LLATEACNCPQSLSNWQYGESYTYDIIGDLNAWAIGWVDWNILLDIQGGPNHVDNFCSSPIVASLSNQTILFQPAYYYMGQISRFVVPNSQRIQVVNSGTAVSVTAVVTPADQIVVIAMNQNEYAVNITLQWGQYGAPYTVPARGISSFLFDIFN